MTIKKWCLYLLCCGLIPQSPSMIATTNPSALRSFAINIKDLSIVYRRQIFNTGIFVAATTCVTLLAIHAYNKRQRTVSLEEQINTLKIDQQKELLALIKQVQDLSQQLQIRDEAARVISDHLQDVLQTKEVIERLLAQTRAGYERLQTANHTLTEQLQARNDSQRKTSAQLEEVLKTEDTLKKHLAQMEGEHQRKLNLLIEQIRIKESERTLHEKEALYMQPYNTLSHESDLAELANATKLNQELFVLNEELNSLRADAILESEKHLMEIAQIKRFSEENLIRMQENLARIEQERETFLEKIQSEKAVELRKMIDKLKKKDAEIAKLLQDLATQNNHCKILEMRLGR